MFYTSCEEHIYCFLDVFGDREFGGFVRYKEEMTKMTPHRNKWLGSTWKDRGIEEEIYKGPSNAKGNICHKYLVGVCIYRFFGLLGTWLFWFLDLYSGCTVQTLDVPSRVFLSLSVILLLLNSWEYWTYTKVSSN